MKDLVTERADDGGGVVVVGAGIGGLTAALHLLSRGADVTICERHDWIGGKLRTVPSVVGPVDAGPTVLTLRHVFEEAFAASGARLDDYVDLVREPLLARHFWPDGSVLDLWDDPDKSADAVTKFADARARREYRAFATEARALFEMFDRPMMRSADPALPRLARAVSSAPSHLGSLVPGRTLAGLLKKRFTDQRLQQLFGRYATYVGGSPYTAPALLHLVSHAEAAGVWRAPGGLHGLAKGLARRIEELGGTFRTGVGVAEVLTDNGGISGVRLETGERLDARAVVFNGEPRALSLGLLGQTVTDAVRGLTMPRSYSARVWSFAAEIADGPPLAHHNVFFSADPREEFDAIAEGRTPSAPSVYLCAQDRGTDGATPGGPERFEIILNAAPLTVAAPAQEEVETCRQTTFTALNRFGLTFRAEPKDIALTTPTGFDTLFPASAGALYGPSPEGALSALRRPRARTAIRGLYLAGGGVHPGPGLPMAALSGRHAAEALMADLVST